MKAIYGLGLLLVALVVGWKVYPDYRHRQQNMQQYGKVQTGMLIGQVLEIMGSPDGMYFVPKDSTLVLVYKPGWMLVSSPIEIATRNYATERVSPPE